MEINTSSSSHNNFPMSLHRHFNAFDIVNYDNPYMENQSQPLINGMTTIIDSNNMVLERSQVTQSQPLINNRNDNDNIRGKGDNDDKDSNKGKKGSVLLEKKKTKKHRYAFQTRSQVDILDDGYRWRKYGQKAVKNNMFPRSYYRCTHQGCNVKKQVQRLTKDEEVVVTTYEGMHSHSIDTPTDNFEHILSQMQIYTSLSSHYSN